MDALPPHNSSGSMSSSLHHTSGTASNNSNSNSNAHTHSNANSSNANKHWSAALRGVLRQQKQQTAADEAWQRRDGLGVALAQRLNASGVFTYPSSFPDEEDLDEETSLADVLVALRTPPLLSRRNAHVLQAWFRTVLHPTDSKRRRRCPWQPTRAATLQATAVCLACGVLLVGGPSGVLALAAAQYAVSMATAVLLFLMDWQDLTRTLHLPAWLVQGGPAVWQWLDAVALRGHVYQLREWTDADFCNYPDEQATTTITSSVTTSRQASLWQLPPPTIKEGGKRLCTDVGYLARASWSADTVAHVQAVDFCYVMMREHHLAQQARRKQRQHQTSGHAEATTEDGVTVWNERPTEEAIELEMRSDQDSVATGDDSDYDNVVRRNPLLSGGNPLLQDRSCESSVNSSASDVVSELPWLDVGAKIGMRLLNSAHVHRAAVSTQEGTEGYPHEDSFTSLDQGTSMSAHALSAREGSLHEIVLPSLQVAGGSTVAPGGMRQKPVHPLWTSPGAAAAADAAAFSPPSSPRTSRPSSPHRPPKSPTSPTTRRGNWLPRRHSAENLSSQEAAAALLVNHHHDNQRATITDLRSPRRPTRATSSRRAPLPPGVRVAVPVTPHQPGAGSTTATKKRKLLSHYQMGSVVRSERIWVHDTQDTSSLTPNCLSVTVKLERSFLRNGEFADLTFRVMDHWADRYMPKHSKVPIGSCVATTFGIGVLVGWRVEDDCHVVRSLWRRRGPGAAHAYLNRSAIHGEVEAAVGFSVETRFGAGQVLAYVDGGPRFDQGRFFVTMPQSATVVGRVLELGRPDIYSCHGAQFIPVIEHIREAAHFQAQLDQYQESLQLATEKDEPTFTTETLEALCEILWASFLKAVDEDKEFDDGVNEFMTSVIDFLERLDGDKEPEDVRDDATSVVSSMLNDFEVECVAYDAVPPQAPPVQEPGFWFTNDIFGGVFGAQSPDSKPSAGTSPAIVESPTQLDSQARDVYFKRVFAVMRTLMKTVSYARVACVDKPHLRLGLAITYDVLLFVRTIAKVQQKNVSVHSLKIWQRAIAEIWSTFGPIKERLERIGQGIAQRMEQQGKKAKAKVVKFVDTILGDERLLIALEQGDWDRCIKQVESALIVSKILERVNLVNYRKTLSFLYDHVRLMLSNNKGAARRNSEKIAILAKVIQWIVTPRRSLLRLFDRDDVLDMFERILVRVFHKEELASRKLVIHALNFHSLRHLRMLKDFSTSSGLWMPVVDAADEEFSWMVSHLPQNTKDVMSPISSLFSLCVAQFHNIADGNLTMDWMDFLLHDDAVQIIHDIDMKLILALEALSRDVKDMLVVLPYYSNIDNDILNLMDEVDFDEFLREASDAMDDPDKLTHFIREKATIAVQRFLDWLPRISIPVEKRDLMEGWVLTCRGEDGGDLTLSDVSVKKENLVCQIMGGDALFFPMFTDDSDEENMSDEDIADSPRHGFSTTVIEESALDHIREMLLQAQRYGCWKSGVGGVGQPPSDRYVASVLQGLPVSTVLNCAIELWRNLDIDDDELLEIAIKDVSYQIQLQKLREENADGPGDADEEDRSDTEAVPTSYSGPSVEVRMTESSSSQDSSRRRFNPRVDPTILFLDMKNLTLKLDNFMFRIEKNEKRTLLDPVFEGKGSLTIQNVSIRVRVECAKERVRKTALGETFAPVLILKELLITLEQVKLRVRDTAFGSDWLVNKAVHAFGDDITKVVEENLREQIQHQVKTALENLNSYFLVNPNMLLNLLGISMEDLDDNVIWV